MLTTGGTGEHQVGDVDAGDQQHHYDGTHEDEEGGS
jgi:hypothetical protein